jgi:hypothetical protein
MGRLNMKSITIDPIEASNLLALEATFNQTPHTKALRNLQDCWLLENVSLAKAG